MFLFVSQETHKTLTSHLIWNYVFSFCQYCMFHFHIAFHSRRSLCIIYSGKQIHVLIGIIKYLSWEILNVIEALAVGTLT